MKKLNLGCGGDVCAGWENYDINPVDCRVKYMDLNKLPWKFKSNSVDIIHIGHVLEHLNHPQEIIMQEIHRILKSYGRVTIILPTWSSKIKHKTFFHPRTYFNGVEGFKLRRVSGRGFHPFKLMFKRICGLLRDMCYQENIYFLEKR